MPVAVNRPPPPVRWRPNWGVEEHASGPSGGAFAPRAEKAKGGGMDDEAALPLAAPADKPADLLGSTEGSRSIAVSREMKKMKEQQFAPNASQPVRTAGGRTYLWRDGGWIDSEAAESPGQQLKVKYLSAAYFALLKERPDLKAGLSLGNRVVLVVAKGKSVVIAPNEGEESADKVVSFLK
jgi:Ca-activated chloride channel family protein